ncbi:MAG: prepilin-type N-terminal cleavage/methylation domain-containing protein [Bryobacteraceae bacterium]|jgi:prepilin-type N-terminal cleavage/methylation domain-containing protein
MRTLQPEAGLTLIEILVAVSLLSLLSVGMLMAMRIGFNTMEKTDAHLVQNRRVSNSSKIIENEIAGFTFTRAEWRPTPEMDQFVPFAQWEAQSMRFVTTYSLQDAWRGRAQIAALQVIPGDRGAGVRLIVDETPYTGPAQAGQSIVSIDANGPHFAPILPNPQSFVLADRLAFCRFSYLEPRYVAPFRIWRPDWIQPQQLPLGIRIEMAPLDTTPAELHVSTVTVPLTVNLQPGSTYSDAQ